MNYLNRSKSQLHWSMESNKNVLHRIYFSQPAFFSQVCRICIWWTYNIFLIRFEANVRYFDHLHTKANKRWNIKAHGKFINEKFRIWEKKKWRKRIAYIASGKSNIFQDADYRTLFSFIREKIWILWYDFQFFVIFFLPALFSFVLFFSLTTFSIYSSCSENIFLHWE